MKRIIPLTTLVILLIVPALVCAQRYSGADGRLRVREGTCAQNS